MMSQLSYLLPLIIVGCGAVLLMILSAIKRFSMEQLSMIAFVFLAIAFCDNLYYFGLSFTLFPFEDVFINMFIVNPYTVYFVFFFFVFPS